MRSPFVLLVPIGIFGCVGAVDDTAPAADYALPGPHTAGRLSVWLPGDTRDLTISVWHPSDTPATEGSMLDLAVEPADREAYEALLTAAPSDCPSRTTQATANASLPEPPATGWPILLMSHCHTCTRFSTLAIAEHLATWGFVVLAPDHAGNTMFDALAGTALPLDTDTLALRVEDLTRTLDAADDLGLPLDHGRVGAFGHSFGAVTIGMVLQADPTVRAGMFVGAPPENPLLDGVSMDNLAQPLLFEILAEDHSVGAAGNVLIEGNYEAAPGPAWLVELADAGHFSPSDLVGLEGENIDFSAGCGDDTRESNGEAFTYMPAADGRGLSSGIAAAFFTHTLNGDEAAGDWLDAPVDARVGVRSNQ